jgi:hypothetical protein
MGEHAPLTDPATVVLVKLDILGPIAKLHHVLQLLAKMGELVQSMVRAIRAAAQLVIPELIARLLRVHQTPVKTEEHALSMVLATLVLVHLDSLELIAKSLPVRQLLV